MELAADSNSPRPAGAVSAQAPEDFGKPLQVCDLSTEGLLYLMLVAAPWAFGATSDWAIWSLTAAGYILGGLLVTKWLLRHKRLKGRGGGQALFFLPVSTEAGPALARRSL